MALYIKDILACIEHNAPHALAEPWDNVGLLVGDELREVHHILIALDPTSQILDEAIALKADTIITHHPLIFHPVSAINTACPLGKIIEKALVNKISIIGCHTNLDNAAGGVSHALATALGLNKLSPLVPATPPAKPSTGSGCIGNFLQPVDTYDFLQQILNTLHISNINIAGPIPEKTNTVAVCGGSGSSFTEAAYKSGADLYITAEIKHDIARWAEEYNFCVIDAGHYATEQFAISLMAEKLRITASNKEWQLEITETKTEKNPFICIGNNSFITDCNNQK